MLLYVNQLRDVFDPGDLPELVLDHAARRRVRAKLTLRDGTEVAWALPRGTVLHAGDQLETAQGEKAVVRAAEELLCVAFTTDPRQLARIAYHLGNRHAPVQLATGFVCFPHDPVLQSLCERLGATVATQWRPFEPELVGHDHADSHH